MKNIRNAWERHVSFPKMDLKMKFSLLFFFVTLFQIHADSGYAQKTKLSLDMHAVSVLEVMEEIEEISEYRFIYSKTDSNINRVVSIRARKKHIKDILQALFKETSLHYEVIDKQIILTSPPKKKVSPNQKNIREEQQQVEVSGTITSSDREPLAGVNIIVKGSNRGTMSDPDGKYNITVLESDVLTFSFIGFKTVERSVESQEIIDVQMEDDVTALQEVEVNAGYYKVKDRERTGSIVKVTSEEIELQPIVNPLEALQGRMAGVEINKPNGVPGTAASIQIRGRNSLRNTTNDNGNLPLFIIDGVPVNSSPIQHLGGGQQSVQAIDPLNTLNLSNIESIEVLKDADATAIYGSRGANGVVLITTKSGVKGAQKTILSIDAYSGIGKVSNRMKLLNMEQYLEMRREAFANDGAESSQFADQDLLVWDQNRYTDWQKELFGGTSDITDVQVALSGGTENTSFRFGGAYHKEGTVFPGDFDYQKLTGFINLNHTSSNNRLRATMMVNYGIDRNNLFLGGNLVQTALTLAPNAPTLFTEDGELNWENSTWNNPLAGLKRSQRISTNNLIVNSSVSYEILRHLDVKINLGYTKQDIKEGQKDPVSSHDPAIQASRVNSFSQRTTNRDSWIIEPQLNYSLSRSQLDMDVLVGSTFQKSSNDILMISGHGYSDERFIGNLEAADRVNVSSQSEIKYAYSAVFGRIGGNWAKKYFINLTGRRDGSSRFGPGRQFENFWAIGAAWIFSEESFIQKHIPVINFGKLRGSYGTTGSDQIPDYGFYDAYQVNQQGGLNPISLFNPDYGWEVNKKLEAALELGLFKDRLHLETSWYRNRSSNQLVGYPLSVVTGFTSVQANLPATVQNTGWEIVASTKNIQSKSFNWQTHFNITFPRNKLIAFPNIEQTSYATQYVVGEPLNISRLYRYKGINPDTGLYEVEDVNMDGNYNLDDQIIIQDMGRQYYGGLQNNLSFKGIRLDFLLEFIRQYGPSNIFANNVLPPGFSKRNVSAAVLNRWEGPGSSSAVQRYTQSFLNFTNYSLARQSDYGVSSESSFVRLRTVSLSYEIPSVYIQKSGLSSCRLYVHGQNLFTWTRYKGLDPQFPGGNVLPSLRVITMGLQLQF
ncbi:SusC/RagA family TonB-linked outer membrane protein [Sinomicrobium sp. M5D2P9]